MNIPNKLYHKSPISLRKIISNNGLIVQIGYSYKSHWDGTKLENKLKPLVFLYDKDIQVYDTTYDDDIWEVDMTQLSKKYCIKDIDKYMAKNGCFAYTKDIPSNVIKLIHKGSGKSL